MPKGKNANKAPKDPHAPKRPPSAYFIFSNNRRKQLIQEQPKSRITELSKVISKEWKEMEQEKKDDFDVQAKQRKAEYVTALEEYKKSDNYKQFQKQLALWKEEQAITRKAKKNKIKNSKYKEPKKPKKPANFPKRPLSSYFLFSNERRKQLQAQYPQKKITELSKMISEEWKEMSDESKKQYEDTAIELKAKHEINLKKWQESDECAAYDKELDLYKQEHKQWEINIANESNENDSESESYSSSYSRSRSRSRSRSGSDKENSRSISMDRKHKRKHKSKHKHGKSKKGKSKSGKKGGLKLPTFKKPKKPVDPNCPKKPPSSYFLFTSEARPKLREEHPDTKITEIAKMLGKMWKELDEDKKAVYDANAKTQKKEYEEKMKEYQATDGYQVHKKKLEEWQADVDAKQMAHREKVLELQKNHENSKKSSKHGSKSSTRSPKKNKSSKNKSKKSSKSKHGKSKKSKNKNKSKYDSDSSYSSRSPSRSRSRSRSRGRRRRRSRTRSRSRSGSYDSRSYSRSYSRSASRSYSRSRSKSRSRSRSGSSRSRSRSYSRSRSGSYSRSRSYSSSRSRSRS